MSKYIDAEKLKRTLIDKYSFLPAFVVRAIEESPAVDVVEVKHGKWIDLGRNYYTVISQCSVCESKYDFRPPYCPNCGAKMEGVYND